MDDKQYTHQHIESRLDKMKAYADRYQELLKKHPSHDIMLESLSPQDQNELFFDDDEQVDSFEYKQHLSRPFRYLSNDVLLQVFDYLNKECHYCKKDKFNSLRFQKDFTKDPKYICIDCISDGKVGRSIEPIEFNPIEPLLEYNYIPLKQAHTLAFKTPTVDVGQIDDHCKYGWARHCGDFAMYCQRLEPEIVGKMESMKLLRDAGHPNPDGCWDGDEFIQDYLTEISFHRFECLHCGENIITVGWT